MGLGPAAPEKRLISAKGKFCEACGEAIFVKQGAPDEGIMLEGSYLCRMCAQIAEKQRGADADYLPSYAKIVRGEGSEEAPAGEEPGVEIVEVDEVDLGELIGGTAPEEQAGEAAPSAGEAAARAVFGEADSDEALDLDLDELTREISAEVEADLADGAEGVAQAQNRSASEETDRSAALSAEEIPPGEGPGERPEGSREGRRREDRPGEEGTRDEAGPPGATEPVVAVVPRDFDDKRDESIEGDGVPATQIDFDAGLQQEIEEAERELRADGPAGNGTTDGSDEDAPGAG
jgi:hypothetical protein